MRVRGPIVSTLRKLSPPKPRSRKGWALRIVLVLVLTLAMSVVALVGLAFLALVFFAGVVDDTSPSVDPLIWANLLAFVTFLCIGFIIGGCLALSARWLIGQWFVKADGPLSPGAQPRYDQPGRLH